MPRRLGQHFLNSKLVLEQLAVATCGEHCERVVEIGPGRGALTRYLLPRTDELHVVELDSGLVGSLQAQFRGESKLQIHAGDVLVTDLTQWGGAALAGNLPYYITSPIIEKFLEMDERFRIAVFLMQWEVAARVMAKPGSRDYGYLSVFCQLICDVGLVCKVPAGAFHPPPKVESGAVRFERKQRVNAERRPVLELASRAFQHKRKTLRNNLKPFYGLGIEDQPEAGLRAEQLSVEQFIDLHKRLVSYTEAS